MILLVLLHKGKGSGLSDLFGGGVSSTYGGSSVVEKNLDRITIVVGGLWFAGVVALSLYLNAIRGSRVGAGPMGEAERGEAIARFRVSYWCANGHETRPSFAEDGTVAIPNEWDCPRCGFPAGLDKDKPPMPVKNEPYKTHLAYVKERRTEAEAEKILGDALAKLRGDD
eukprot:gene5365-5417_t